MPIDPSIPLKAVDPITAQSLQDNQTAAIKNAYLPIQIQNEAKKAQAEQQLAQITTTKAKLGLMDNLLGSAQDQASYDTAKQQAVAAGIDVSNTPDTYDPAFIKQTMMAHLDAKDRIDLAQKQVEMQLNQAKFGEEQRHNKASEGIAATRPLVSYMNGAGAFADPALVQKLGGTPAGSPSAIASGVDANNPASMPAAAPNPADSPASLGAVTSPSQLPAGTLQPPVATNAPVGTLAGAPSGTATLGAPSFAPNPAASPNATGVPAGVTPVSTFSGDASPSFYQRSPTQQALLKKVADYEMTPQEAFGRAGGAKSMAMAALATDFKGYDSTHYAEKVATVKDYAPGGKDGQKYQSLNQLGSHLAEGDKLFSALGNSSFIPENQIINYAKQITGNASITDASLARAAISDETGRLMRGVGMSDAESEKYASALANSNSPAQFQGALNTIADLVGGRMKALNFGYDQALGKPGVAAQKFIDPETKAILVKHSPGLAKDLGVSTDAHPLTQTPQAADIKAKLQSGAITYEQAAAALKALK